MERVDISILGREYSLSCPAEEKEALSAAAQHVSQLAGRIQGTGKISGNERIAVMAAIQIAVELLSMRAPDGLGSLAVGDFKLRIDALNAIIDSVSTH